MACWASLSAKNVTKLSDSKGVFRYLLFKSLTYLLLFEHVNEIISIYLFIENVS